MKKCYFTIILLGLIMIGCNNDKDIQQPRKSGPVGAITFAGNADGVKILAYRSTGGNFRYQETIEGVWTDNKLYKNIVLGDYKFLFFKCPQINSLISPSLTSSTTFDQFKIAAKTNNQQGSDYVLPVDEIWLPETELMANKTYKIRGGDKVQNRLTRAVSQITLHLKRASYNNGVFQDSIPYPQGTNIMESFKNIQMRISGVGEAIDVSGGIGDKKMYVELGSSDAQIEPTGFAYFNGPFVFPNATGADTEIEFTLNRPDGSTSLPMIKTLSGKLERNKKLDITLWLANSDQFIDITYEIDFISEPEQGDEGLWE